MKRLLLLGFAVLLIGSAKAQELSYGPKAGFNITNVSNWEQNNKFSFHLGAFAEYRLSEFVGLQGELLYSRQGAADGSTKYRVNYLNLPVIAKLYVLENLSVDLGPQFGIALNGNVKAKSGNTKTKTKILNLNTIDVSWAMGVSYELDMGLIFSARYNLGLTNVVSGGDNNKNHVFQLSAAWRFSDLF